jgi:DNA-binding response OmpR family regulator
MPAPIRVLSVSREAVLRLTRQKILEQESFTVHSVTGGDEIASATEAHGPFDLVILGQSLEGEECKAATAWLRTHQPSAKILLIGIDARDLDQGQYDEILDSFGGAPRFIATVKWLTNSLSSIPSAD